MVYQYITLALSAELGRQGDFIMTGHCDYQTELDLSNLHKEITEKLQVRISFIIYFQRFNNILKITKRAVA